MKNNIIDSNENLRIYTTTRIFPTGNDYPSIDTEMFGSQISVNKIGHRIGNEISSDEANYEITLQQVEDNKIPASMFIQFNKQTKNRLIEILQSL